MQLHQLKHQPERLATIHKGLAALGNPAAILCGGCLYDTDNNRPVHDYDMMVTANPQVPSAEMAQRFADAVGGTPTPEGPSKDRFYITADDGTLIDIFMSQPQFVNISRADNAATGLGGIIMDLATGLVGINRYYLRDKSERLITLLDEAQMQFALKLQGKYPTHAIVAADTEPPVILRPALQLA